MSADPAVRARIDLERRRLDRIEEWRTTGSTAALLQAFAGDRLSAIVADLRARFNQLERKATKRIDYKVFGDLAGLQTAVDRAAAEALELATGTLARHAGLDANACKEADELVIWLADKLDRRFIRPSVPGSEDALHRATDVIYRRVPDHGLWDLPVMAHEFGHLLAAGLRSWDPRDDQLLSPVETWLANFQDRARTQAVELFCDVFATYAMGPAYLCALVFHRLSPVATARASAQDTHPGDPCRVFACQWTLQQMRGKAVLHPYDAQLLRAKAVWDSMQADAPAEARLTDDLRAELRRHLSGCWVAVSTTLGAVAYRPSPSINDIVAYLDAPSADVPDSRSPADVLNAAWMVRLGTWYDGRRVAAGMAGRATVLLRRSLERITDA